MATQFKPSAACCSSPKVLGPPYEAKGRFDEIDGTKIYVNSTADSTKALLVMYDIFGYSSQILQGADKLAEAGYQVFMPDFFDGKPAPLAWMPIPDEATGVEPPADDKAIDAFCEGPGNTEKTIPRVLALQQLLQEKYPKLQEWGLVGYCWGGYMANFLLESEMPFKACAELHPGFPGREIAEKITKPIIALCSKDEPETDYAHFQPHLQSHARFIQFPDMVHGWMSARGDLRNSRVLAEYERGYALLVEFFQQHL